MSTRDAGQVRGLPNTEANQRGDLSANQATANKVATNRAALDVASLGFAQLVASDAAEANTTTSSIVATSHSALAGDVIIWTSGALNRQMFTVFSVSANAIVLGQTASVAASAADTFDILRFALPRIDSSGGVRIGTVSGTVTADTELPAAAALADNTANPTIPSVGAMPHLFDGTTWDRAPGTSADGALVNLGSNNDIMGQVAHDAAISGNPVHIGAHALSTEQAAVGSGDVTRLLATLLGKLVIQPYSIPQNTVHAYAAATTTTAAVTLTAAAASTRYYLTTVYWANISATPVSSILRHNGSGDFLRVYVPAGQTIVLTFPTPIRGNENQTITFESTASITSLYCGYVGYTSSI